MKCTWGVQMTEQVLRKREIKEKRIKVGNENGRNEAK